MIDKVVIRNFKRFSKVEFDLARRNVVLAGPNNGGKTTVLQAISAWSFAFQRWLSSASMVKQDQWQRVPITRQQFYPLSVGTLDSLWFQRLTGVPGEEIVIEVTAEGRTLGMEFLYDTQEQMFVRPTSATTVAARQRNTVQTVFVPAMTGMITDEPEYKPAKLEQMLGQNRPGEVLRNLMLLAAQDQAVWNSLTADIEHLFGIRVLSPDDSGADIVAECFHVGAETPVRLDIASCGSGFQQVLMLLTFLGTRPGSVLLLDEPDAHLHVFLQERIHQRLVEAAARTKSQLIIATHSEVIIDAVEHDEIYVVIDQPVRLVDRAQVKTLKDAMRWLGNTDLMKARMAPGVLYLEGSTDLALLRAWAKVLQHAAVHVLEPSPFWRSISRAQHEEVETVDGEEGVQARPHYEALQLARPGYPALLIEDRDRKEEKRGVFGKSPPMWRWRWYEIESYLVHPDALERFVVAQLGTAFSDEDRSALREAMAELLTKEFVVNPLTPTGPAQAVLRTSKASEDLLPKILDAAGLLSFPKPRYHEIAAQMLPSEIHQDVKDVLDAICSAFGIPLSPPPPAGGKS